MPENMHTSSIIKTEQAMFRNTHTYTYIYICMYVCIYMDVTTINEKRSHEFKQEQGGVYGRVWGGKRREGLYNYNLKKNGS